MKTPEYLILGAPKCGTSSLYHYLKEHPDIYLPERKELHFFSRGTIKKYINGPSDADNLHSVCDSSSDYFSFFQGADSKKIVCEVSTSYFFLLENYIDEIIATLSQLKGVVVILRNPVKRMYSNYLHMVRSEKETLSFFEALEAESERMKSLWGTFWWYRTQSYYYKNLSLLAKSIGEERLLIVTQEEMENNTPKLLTKLFTFLGADPGFIPANADIRYNKGGRFQNDAVLRWMTTPSSIKRAIGKLLPGSVTKNLQRLKARYIEKKTANVSSLTSNQFNQCMQFFKEDVHKILTRFNINLTPAQTDSFVRQYEQ